MRILDTAERKRKEEIKEDLRKAIRHTLDNVDVDEAWEALGESLQDAMNAIGLGPGDKDGEFAETIALVTLALAVKEEQKHPMWLIEVGDSPLTSEDFQSVKEQVESWSSTGPGEVILMSEPVFVGKFVTLDDPEKHAGLLRNFSMGCAAAPPPCPFCDGDDKCDC